MSLNKTLYKKYEGISICLVNGQYIRDNLYIDWTQGGHHYVSEDYDYIPTKEIWIDENLNAKDRDATILHELIERTLMTERKYSYEKGHEIASSHEINYRKSKTKSNWRAVKYYFENTFDIDKYRAGEEIIAGGISQGYSVSDIAKIHGVSVTEAHRRLKQGMKVEAEHSPDEEVQAEIAKDHLFENIDYYKLLEKYVEKKIDGGGLEGNLDNSKLGRIFVQNFTKDEIKHIISGKNQVSNGAAIQAAASYLRRSESANPVSKESLDFKNQEKLILINYIDEKNLWFDKSKLGVFLDRGAEQKVYLTNDNHVIKTNDCHFYACYEDYFNSLLLHNYFFPDTAYELVGFVKDDNLLYCVVKQIYIKATGETDLQKVKEIMANNGFVNTKNNDYYNPKLGIVLEDLHDENVLESGDVAYFIDTVFFIRENYIANTTESSSSMANGGGIPAIRTPKKTEPYLSGKPGNKAAFRISTPEHALEYGITCEKPLYIEELLVCEGIRNRGIGSSLLKSVEKHATENGCDIVFGHIAQKAKFTSNKGSVLGDIRNIKAWLHDRGYAVNDQNNDFHKVLKANTETMDKYEGTNHDKTALSLYNMFKDISPSVESFVDYNINNEYILFNLHINSLEKLNEVLSLVQTIKDNPLYSDNFSIITDLHIGGDSHVRFVFNETMEHGGGLEGGLLKGQKHSECNPKTGCGIKAVVTDQNNRPVELEAQELIVAARVANDTKTKTYTGTNKEIINQMQLEHGANPVMEDGGEVMAEGGGVGRSILNQDTDLLGDNKKLWMLTKEQFLKENEVANINDYWFVRGETVERHDFKGKQLNPLHKFKPVIRTNDKLLEKYNIDFYKGIVFKSKAEFDRWFKENGQNLFDDLQYQKITEYSDGVAHNLHNYKKAISEGRMTANDAKAIIESAYMLEVPADVLAMGENKPAILESKEDAKYLPQVDDIWMDNKKNREFKIINVSGLGIQLQPYFMTAQDYLTKPTFSKSDFEQRFTLILKALDREFKSLLFHVNENKNSLLKEPKSEFMKWKHEEYNKKASDFLEKHPEYKQEFLLATKESESDDKQPWEITRDEYIKNKLQGIGAQRKGNVIILKAIHRNAVAQAVSEGLPVPQNVLAEYSELKKEIPMENHNPDEAILETSKELNNIVNNTNQKLQEYLKGKRQSSGLLPDEFKTTEYLSLKKDFDKAFANLRDFNGKHQKFFKQQAIERRKTRGNAGQHPELPDIDASVRATIDEVLNRFNYSIEYRDALILYLNFKDKDLEAYQFDLEPEKIDETKEEKLCIDYADKVELSKGNKQISALKKLASRDNKRRNIIDALDRLVSDDFLSEGDGIGCYYLTESGKNFIEKIAARLESRKSLSKGDDLFPEYTGIVGENKKELIVEKEEITEKQQELSEFTKFAIENANKTNVEGKLGWFMVDKYGHPLLFSSVSAAEQYGAGLEKNPMSDRSGFYVIQTLMKSNNAARGKKYFTIKLKPLSEVLPYIEKIKTERAAYQRKTRLISIMAKCESGMLKKINEVGENEQFAEGGGVGESRGIKITDYSEKAILVTGETKPIKEELKSLGGVWNGRLLGWIFSKKKQAALEAYLEQGVSESDVQKTDPLPYTKLNLEKLLKEKTRPRKDVIIREIEANKMEYAVHKSFNGMYDSTDYHNVTNDDFKPAEEAIRTYNSGEKENFILKDLEQAIGQSHYIYSARVQHSESLGYYIDFDDYYIRYKPEYRGETKKTLEPKLAIPENIPVEVTQSEEYQEAYAAYNRDEMAAPDFINIVYDLVKEHNYEIEKYKDAIRGFTNAPESYDGFGTKTVAQSEYWDERNNRFLREILIPKTASDSDWQINRYRSGNYGFFTDEEMPVYFKKKTTEIAEHISKPELSFVYGKGFGIPKEYSIDLQKELIARGVKITGVTKDNAGLIVNNKFLFNTENNFLIYDNGGEFNVENRTTDEYITSVAYDGMKGKVKPLEIAENIIESILAFTENKVDTPIEKESKIIPILQPEKEPTKQDYIDAIVGMETMLEFAEESEKQQYIDTINGLKTMLEFL